MVTKKTATISGSLFTVSFFAVFIVSEWHNRRKRVQAEADQEKFRLEERPSVSIQDVRVRPGSILVEAKYPDQLEHLQSVLKDLNPAKQDVVVMAVHRVAPYSTADYQLPPDQICSNREVDLFSKVVSVAEKAGKHVELLTVPAESEAAALIFAAQQLDAARVVASYSSVMSPEDQAREVGQAWEQLPEPRRGLTLEIVPPNGAKPLLFSLGPHPPRLWPHDIDLVHRLWHELSNRAGIGSRLHHRDVVSVALQRLDEQLHSNERQGVLEHVERELTQQPEGEPESGQVQPENENSAEHDLNPT